MSNPQHPSQPTPQAAPPITARASSRLWRGNRYIYPVLARRTGGVSIGVNLNVDKICNFGCIYCEVNREVAPSIKDVDLAALTEEMRATLALAKSGDLLRDERFAGRDAPEGGALRVTDIAFSGDGEPTSFRNFKEVVERAIALRDEAGLAGVKIIVITNASLFHRPRVREALALVDGAGGEVWAKLDAGTPEYFKLIDESVIPYERILRNIRDVGRAQPLVIQSCFMRVRGAGPSDEEIAAYIGRVQQFIAEGAQIKLVQVYSVSRPPAESYVTALPPAELESIRSRVEAALGGVPVRRFDGTWTGTA
ncbi:MAG TPA: radical SAM protein [Ktedonobacterales bacterium]|jgi:wyosine [tRNA(Phe)-imidazoG37] synthetase (radical SAM superfamily)